MYEDCDMLHALVEYKGYTIYVFEHSGEFDAIVFLKETEYTSGKWSDPKTLLSTIKDWIDGEVEDAVLDEIYGRGL